MKRFARSLTLKLILVYVGVSILGVMLVGAAFRVAFRDHFQDNVKPHLDLYVSYLLADIGTPPERARALAITGQIPVRIHYLGREASWSTHDDPVPELSEVHFWRKSHRNQSRIRFGSLDDQEIALILGDGYQLVLVNEDEDERPGIAILLPLLVIGGLFVALYLLTQRLFSPLRQIRSAMTAFGEGDLDRRLSLKRRDELGDVAHSFSEMAERIQQMLESKRQLLLAISHELRSPLTRAKVATAMLENAGQRREIELELAEMESLVGELLETERLNAGHKVLNLEPVDLRQLLESVAVATSGSVNRDLPAEPLEMMLDASRCRLVVRNLLENALKHTPVCRPAPTLRLQVEAHWARIEVTDCGDGVSAEHVEHLCEPFYRVDPSRQRATGGYGLGLYLCKAIASAHGGTLSVSSEVGKGTTVRVDLPLHH